MRIYKINIVIEKGNFNVFGDYRTLVNLVEESHRTGLFMVGGVMAIPTEDEMKAMQEAKEKQEEQANEETND